MNDNVKLTITVEMDQQTAEYPDLKMRRVLRTVVGYMYDLTPEELGTILKEEGERIIRVAENGNA